jgi:two-component system CheB/CheR fusion protein
VVGLGASAGGLEALERLLKHLPPTTGMAYVLVQHLDPRHGSALPELLARATRMPVHLVTNGMSVEPDHVYVIPPNTTMRLEGGLLHLERRAEFGHHMPIDFFFRSLAASRGSRAVAVILSGTASDGTLGLKTIKSEGGIAFAQDATARYDGMPRNAIAAGCVDFVLPPEGIAKELVRLSRHTYFREAEPSAEEAQEPEPHDFSEIFALLRTATNVDFTYYKPGTLRRRVLRRMALNKIDSVAQYVQFVRGRPEEVGALFQDILINVTAFFREPATFEALRKRVFPELLRERTSEPLRIWVPGCSTGEEVYSLAIVLLEYTREIGLECPCQIFGTDLSDAALEKARAGIYPESVTADVSPERLRRFFTRSNGGYQVNRAVRELCVFARQNVTRDPPFSRLDLICCRNVLIYLGAPLQAKVMRIFHYALKSSGYLALGTSETIGSAGELFTPALDKQLKIYKKKDGRGFLGIELDAYEERSHAAHPSHEPRVDAAQEAIRAVDHLILARYSPAGVVIAKDMRVLQFRGHTAPYLEHSSGDANLNIVSMARGALGVEIRKLVQRAVKKDISARSDVVLIGDKDQMRRVRVTATPIQPRGFTEKQYLVLFEDVEEAAAETEAPAARKTSKDSPRLRELERELAATKQYLQTVIEEQEAATEELKSANEEIQSSNEELQSTNEELLTAKEELQSTNEELTTVNEEMQGRNTELSQTNNDLLNLLSTVNIPILMLGMDLRIHRFTPQAEKIFNLLPTDVGRPLRNFRPKINIPDLEQLCQEVIDTLATRQREVEDGEGRLYSMSIRPYRTAESRIEGVVLTLFDVTGRTHAVETRYRRLFEAAKDGILIADAKTGEVLDVNPFLLNLAGYARPQIVGHAFWDTPAFRDTELNRALLVELKRRDAVHLNVAMHTQSGNPAHMEISCNAYSEGDRRVVQFNIRDLGGRRLMDGASRRGNQGERSTQDVETVSRMADAIVRDCNDALTSIMGHTALLRQHLDEGAAAEHARQVMNAAQRAAALTRQLRAFGYQQPIQPEILYVNDVVREAAEILRTNAAQNIELALDLGEPPDKIRADRVQIAQLLIDVATAACETMPYGGRLAIQTGSADVDAAFARQHPSVTPGKYVAISVSETAAAPGDAAAGDRSWFAGGAGAALPGILRTVRQNGGCVWALSELGRGSMLRIYWPRVEETPAAEAPAAEVRGGKENVLVVDENDALRSLTAAVLENYGYRVIQASNGAEALAAVTDGHGPQLLLTAASLPGMSGGELAGRIRLHHPGLRVLHVSSHPEEAFPPYGSSQDADAVLQKPFTPEALALKVRLLLDQPAVHEGGSDWPQTDETS